MVVHREPEQDHEHEDRQPLRDPAVGREAEQVRAPAPLEDGDEHAVGGADRQQVEHDRLARDHDRAERDEQEQEREHEHEAEDERGLLLEQRVLDRATRRSRRSRRSPRRRPCRSSPAGSRCAASRALRSTLQSVPLPTSGMSTRATVCALFASTSIEPVASPASLTWVFRSVIACCVRGESTSAWIATSVSEAVPFEKALWIFLIVGTVGALFGSASRPLCAVWMWSTGSAIATSTAAAAVAAIAGWRSTGVRIDFQNRFSPPSCAEPVQERDLALVDLVAEPREQRRQHRQRAEHRDADDHHRGDAEAEVGLVAGEDHPGHRDHHGEAGDQNRAARGRGGGLDRGAASCVPAARSSRSRLM